MPDSFDGFRSLWPGADPGGRMRGMHPSTSHFQNFFDVYNLSIISNLFDSTYALSTHNRKCAKKMHHIWRTTQN